MEEVTTVDLLFKQKELEAKHKFPTYLSMKDLGDICDRKKWLTFRWASKDQIEGRVKRLFEAGFYIEDKLIQELKNTGSEVIDVDSKGRQTFLRGKGYLSHLVGARDCIARGFVEYPGEWVLGDVKSANDKNFKKIVSEGMRVVYPYYVTQLMMYIGYSEDAQLKRGFLLTENKNDSDLDIQWFDFEPETFEKLKSLAYQIITSDRPAKREFSRGVPMSPCKFCKQQAVCYGEAMPEVNCRTCIHSTPNDTGKWECGLHGKELSFADQVAGCSSHLYIPEILDAYEALDGSDESIRYMQKKRKIIIINAINPTQTNEFTSLELKEGKHEEETLNPKK